MIKRYMSTYVRYKHSECANVSNVHQLYGKSNNINWTITMQAIFKQKYI